MSQTWAWVVPLGHVHEPQDGHDPPVQFTDQSYLLRVGFRGRSRVIDILRDEVDVFGCLKDSAVLHLVRLS